MVVRSCVILSARLQRALARCSRCRMTSSFAPFASVEGQCEISHGWRTCESGRPSRLAARQVRPRSRRPKCRNPAPTAAISEKRLARCAHKSVPGHRPEAPLRAADRSQFLKSCRMQGACAQEVAMSCKPIVVLVIALALGSSSLSTSAFARDGRGASGGRAYGSSHVAGCFDRGRMAGGCGDYGERVDGLHGGSDQGYDRSDVWGHWGGYYGPMIR
jgi:hypothetical protein